MKKTLLIIFLFVFGCSEGKFWLSQFSIPNVQAPEAVTVDVSGISDTPIAAMAYSFNSNGYSVSQSTLTNYTTNIWAAPSSIINIGGSNRVFNLDVRYPRTSQADNKFLVAWTNETIGETRARFYFTNGSPDGAAEQLLFKGGSEYSLNPLLFPPVKSCGQFLVALNRNNNDYEACVTQVYNQDNGERGFFWLVNRYRETDGWLDPADALQLNTDNNVPVGSATVTIDCNGRALITAAGRVPGNQRIDAVFSTAYDVRNDNLGVLESIGQTSNASQNIVSPSVDIQPIDNKCGVALWSGRSLESNIWFTNYNLFQGDSWGNQMTLSRLDALIPDQVFRAATAVNSTGDAIAFWADTPTQLVAAYYDKSAEIWEEKKPIYTFGLLVDSLTAHIDDCGNALVSWVDITSPPFRFYTATYVRNIDQWIEPQLVQEGTILSSKSALNMHGHAALALAEEENASSRIGLTVNRFGPQVIYNNVTTELNRVNATVLASQDTIMLPIEAEQILNTVPASKTIVLNRFATQSEYFNHVVWPRLPGTIRYNVYRNIDCSMADATTPPLVTTQNTFFDDHNRLSDNKDTYCVAAVNEGKANFCNKLEWPAFPGVSQYKILRNGMQIDVLEGDQTMYLDCDVVPGVEYTYVLQICPPDGSACNLITWSPVTGACGYNTYRSDDGVNPSCLYSVPSKELSNGNFAVVDCSLTGENQQYVVTARIGASCTGEGAASDACVVVNFDGSGIDPAFRSGGFNIYRDGVFYMNIPDSDDPIAVDTDCVETGVPHTYIVVAVDNSDADPQVAIETYPKNGVKSEAQPPSVAGVNCCIANTPLCP